MSLIDDGLMPPKKRYMKTSYTRTSEGEKEINNIFLKEKLKAKCINGILEKLKEKDDVIHSYEKEIEEIKAKMLEMEKSVVRLEMENKKLKQKELSISMGDMISNKKLTNLNSNMDIDDCGETRDADVDKNKVSSKPQQQNTSFFNDSTEKQGIHVSSDNIKGMVNGKYKDRFSCHVCSKRFPFKSNLIIHLRCHSDEKPFKCFLCSQQFKQEGNLTYHLSVTHRHHKLRKGKAFMKNEEWKESFFCSYCKKTFNNFYDAKKHTLTCK